MEATNIAAAGVAAGITTAAMELVVEGVSGGRASEITIGNEIGTGKTGRIEITIATKTLETTIMAMHVTTSTRAIITEIISSVTINTGITTSSSTSIGNITHTQTDGNSPSRMKVKMMIGNVLCSGFLKVFSFLQLSLFYHSFCLMIILFPVFVFFLSILLLLSQTSF